MKPVEPTTSLRRGVERGAAGGAVLDEVARFSREEIPMSKRIDVTKLSPLRRDFLAGFRPPRCGPVRKCARTTTPSLSL